MSSKFDSAEGWREMRVSLYTGNYQYDGVRGRGEMAKELLHFQRAVSPHSVITGRNCHLNWQIKQRMNGTNAEPLVPQHYRFKDREISSHMERGEEIRGSGDMETDISVSSSIHPLVLLSPSSSPLPFFFLSALFFLSPALDFGSGFAFAADSFSLSLSSRLLSPSFAAMVTTSSPT